MKYEIESAENGYILYDSNVSSLPKLFVFENFSDLISHIAYNFGEIKIDERFNDKLELET